MYHSQPSSQAGGPYRQLRYVAICGLVPAVALLLPCGILSATAMPALGIAPMFFSAAFQIATIGARPQLPKTTVCIKLLLAAFLFSVLLPSWTFMAERRLKNWAGTDFTMLGSYGTVPMMINFVIHMYLALRAFLTIQWSRRSDLGCCCNNESGCLRAERTEAFASKKDDNCDHEQFMGFSDQHERPSTEYQTSGFGTPRVSQETLDSSVSQSEDLI